MDSSDIQLYSTISSSSSNALLSSEMSLTPTPQTPPPATTATTPRTTTHTPREIPTMYILDQMYDDYMDQYNGNNIASSPTEIPDAVEGDVQLSPCPICARTFNPATLRKHVGICEKMATKRRNIFDSSRQRREGTELATYPLPKNFGLPEKTASTSSITQARNDRGQSPKPTQQISSPLLARKKPAEGLIRSTARASMRKVASSSNTTPPAANIASSTTTPSSNFTRDRLRSSERSLTRRGIQPPPAEQCPHCERCFGIKAFDRHVEWCKEKALLAAIKQGHTKTDGNVAKARWEARTKYRAPCLKTKRSMNREKYAGVPGEENENDENFKYLKNNNNKGQENSLMSMSMTSSMTSERKIKKPTGNINEPSKAPAIKNQAAVAPLPATAPPTTAPANLKCTHCDKSQTPQPPLSPPTTETTTSAAAAAVAAATTEFIQDSVINSEIEMPEMATAAINKKLKAATAAIKKTNANLNSISLSTTKSKQQKQILSRKCDQKLETIADAEDLNLPTTISALALRNTFGDLSSLKSIGDDRRNTEDSFNMGDIDEQKEKVPTATQNVSNLSNALSSHRELLPKNIIKQKIIQNKLKTKTKSLKVMEIPEPSAIRMTKEEQQQYFNQEKRIEVSKKVSNSMIRADKKVVEIPEPSANRMTNEEQQQHFNKEKQTEVSKKVSNSMIRADKKIVEIPEPSAIRMTKEEPQQYCNKEKRIEVSKKVSNSMIRADKKVVEIPEPSAIRMTIEEQQQYFNKEKQTQVSKKVSNSMIRADKKIVDISESSTIRITKEEQQQHFNKEKQTEVSKKVSNSMIRADKKIVDISESSAIRKTKEEQQYFNKEKRTEVSNSMIRADKKIVQIPESSAIRITKEEQQQFFTKEKRTEVSKKISCENVYENSVSNLKNLLNYEDSLKDCHILGSKKVMVLRNDKKRVLKKAESYSAEIQEGETMTTDNIISYPESERLSYHNFYAKLKTDPLFIKQSDPEDLNDNEYYSDQEETFNENTHLNDNKEYSDHEETYDENEKYNSIPKIFQPKTLLRCQTIEKFQKDLNEVSEEETSCSTKVIRKSNHSELRGQTIEKFQKGLNEVSEEETSCSTKVITESNKSESREKMSLGEKSNAPDLLTSELREKLLNIEYKEREFQNEAENGSMPQQDRSDSTELSYETDIYKDCLTDSDELRRNTFTIKSLRESRETLNETLALAESLKSSTGDLNYNKEISATISCAKSDTFILEIDQFENMEHDEEQLHQNRAITEEFDSNYPPSTLQSSSKILTNEFHEVNISTTPLNWDEITNNILMSSYKQNRIHVRPETAPCKRHVIRLDTPRTPSPLRLSRSSTPTHHSTLLQLPCILKHNSSQLSTPLPTTPRAPHSAFTKSSNNIPTKLQITNSIKSLNTYRPKRTKVLRQTVSCSSTLPMKAIRIFKESKEIYGDISYSKEQCYNRSDEVSGDEEEEYAYEEPIDDGSGEGGMKNTCRITDKEIKVIKEATPPPQLKRNKSFTVSGLPDNYDPFLSAKRQLEDLCSPTTEAINIPTTPQTTPQLPSVPATPNTSTMSTSLILSSSTPNTIPSAMTTSQTMQSQTTPKTPTMARSSSFRRTASLRGPRRSPLLTTRPPLFAQKQRPTIQRGLSDEGPISTNFLKPEEYDEMPVRSVCVNDFAVTNSPRVVRRDTTGLQRKQQQQQLLKLNINAANANVSGNASTTASPNIVEPEVVQLNTTSKYVSKTDSLAAFLKYEHELEKLNNSGSGGENKKQHLEDIKEPPTTATTAPSTPLTNLDGPLNAKELKDKSNNLSKQNSAKNIKADILDLELEPQEIYDQNFNAPSTTTALTTEGGECPKYGQVRLAPLTPKPTTPLTKPSTPLTKPTTPLTKPTTPTIQNSTKPSTPQLIPINIKPTMQQQSLELTNKTPKSPKPVALSSIFGGGVDRSMKQSTTTQSSLLYGERKNSLGSDYIDPKLINKCDNLPITLKRTDFKHSDSDTSEPRLEHFSSSSSESSAPAKKSTSLIQQTKFLPMVKQQEQININHHHTNNLNTNHTAAAGVQTHQTTPATAPSISNSQRNSAEGRNLLKRRMRLGRNQFLYDASPEGDSCSADDEANRSSMECDSHNFMKHEHEKAFERLSTTNNNNSIHVQHNNPILDTPPFIPPLPAFDDFDFEEFLSSFENDEEQFPLFKDCREFLMNRTSKKQRSMLMPNSTTLTNTTNNSTNFKKSSQQTFPPLTPQAHSTPMQQHHFQFPSLPQHPKNLFNSFSLNTRAKNKYDDLSNARSTDTFGLTSNQEDFTDVDNQQKREIFISIETEQNDLDKSPISPNTIRNMVGNPHTAVEVELDTAHDNKFSKISDDDDHDETSSSMTRSKNFPGHLPNVQLNNAKNLIQQMQDDFRQLDEEMNGNIRQSTMDHHRTTMSTSTSTQADKMNSNSSPMPVGRHHVNKVNKSTGTPSGDAYADSDELSSLDGYPLSSPNSRLGVSSKTSADSAYGSLSRQRSSELTSQRSSSRSRPIPTVNTLLNRPLTEESSLGRSRQLSASSSSSSEHALPPIVANNSYAKQQQQQQQQQQHRQQQQQQLYNNNNNNNNNDLDDMLRFERNNNNYDIQPHHPSTSTGGTATTNSHSNLESLQQYSSNSTMSTSMKMSRFCHECGSKFLLEQAKFCMDCGIKRIVL